MNKSTNTASVTESAYLSWQVSSPYARAGFKLLKPMIDRGGVELGGGRGQVGVETLLVLAVLFVGVIAGVSSSRKDSAHPHAKRQARSRTPRLWRHAAVLAPAGESGRRHAYHLRQQPVAVSSVLFGYLTRPGRTPARCKRCPTRSSAATPLCITSCTLGSFNFFCYFWTAITFNPKDMGDNLKTTARSFPATGRENAPPTTLKR